jgi:uncharacterized protein YbdZ (MbtH family)
MTDQERGRVTGHRPEFADDVPTGWCECGKPYPHDATEPAGPLDVEPFWNRRWAVFEDEDHRFCIVTDDEAAEYVVWPEMGLDDVQRVVSAHNTVLNVARMDSPGAPREDERLLTVERLAQMLRSADLSLRSFDGRNRSRTAHYWRDMAESLLTLVNTHVANVEMKPLDPSR